MVPLLAINGTQLSDHNRSPFQVSQEDVKVDLRTAHGTRRRRYVASKRIFSVSWERLPALSSQTSDGKAGRNVLASLYSTLTPIPLTLSFTIVDDAGVAVAQNVSVFIQDYTEVLTKRLSYQHWDVSLSMVEI